MLKDVSVITEEGKQYKKFILLDLANRANKPSQTLIISARAYYNTSDKNINSEKFNIGFYTYHNNLIINEDYSTIRKAVQTSIEVNDTYERRCTVQNYGLLTADYTNNYYNSKRLNREDYIKAILYESYLLQKENVYYHHDVSYSLRIEEIPDILIIKNHINLQDILKEYTNLHYKNIFCVFSRPELDISNNKMQERINNQFYRHAYKIPTIEREVLEKITGYHSISTTSTSHSGFGTIAAPAYYYPTPITHSHPAAHSGSSTTSARATAHSGSSATSARVAAPHYYYPTPLTHTTSTTHSTSVTPAARTSTTHSTSASSFPTATTPVTDSSRSNRKYERFLDLFLTSDNNIFDLNHQINQYQEHFRVKYPTQKCYINIDAAHHKIYPLPITEYPNIGYISYCLKLNDIENGILTDETRKLVRWISDPTSTGKIRINCHGDGEGNFAMYTDELKANLFVEWLITAGLRKPNTQSYQNVKNANGLLTINLSGCLHAAYKTNVAKFNDRTNKINSAELSANKLVLNELKRQRFYGIEVTGVSEVATTYQGQKYRYIPRIPRSTDIIYSSAAPFDLFSFATSNTTKSFFRKSYENNRNVYVLPTGWTTTGINTRAGAIIIPSIYTIINDRNTNPNGEPYEYWVLSHDNPASTFAPTIVIPRHWNVDRNSRLIQPPVGWYIGRNSNGDIYLEGSVTTLEQNYLDIEKVTHSNFKVREIS